MRNETRWFGAIMAALFIGGAIAISIINGTGNETKTVTVHSPQVEVAVPGTITPKPGALAPPADSVPTCTPAEIKEVEEGRGHLGVCAPKPFQPAALAPAHGTTGPDVSNNNPISNWGAVARHGHPFAYNKVIQGTRFIDSTAAPMARAQRRVHIVPGGYDFLEVCATSASGEARLFADRLRADGLLARPNFVPMGDAEWPLNAPCSATAARQWLTAWANTLHAIIHRWPGFYTGAWWWNPNVGCWRPPHALRWVSGYIRRSLLPIPCGWGGVDLWQFTDHGFNGVSFEDMSLIETSVSHFLEASPKKLTPKQKREAKTKSLHKHESELRLYHRLVDSHHCRPGQHTTPTQPPRRRRAYHKLCGRWLKKGQELTRTINRYKRELGLTK